MLLLVGFQQGGPLSFVLLTVFVLFLAASAQSSSSLKRYLGLFTYGISKTEMLIGQYCKGVILSALGIIPLQLATRVITLQAPSLWHVAIPTIIAGGLAYLIPPLRRLRSSEFVSLLKN